MQKILSLLSYLLLAVAVAWLIMDRYPPTLKVGQDAPWLLSFTTIDGQSHNFKSLASKPMLVNFWATWCGPCQKELPTLSKMAQKYKDEIIFLGASVSSPIDNILALKRQFFLDYDQVLVSDPVVEKWQARALPTTYIVSTQGKILWAKAGVVSEEELELQIKNAKK